MVISIQLQINNQYVLGQQDSTWLGGYAYTHIHIIQPSSISRISGKGKKKSFNVRESSFHFQLDNPCTSELHCAEILCVCYLFLCGTVSQELLTPLVNRIQHRSEKKQTHNSSRSDAEELIQLQNSHFIQFH